MKPCSGFIVNLILFLMRCHLFFVFREPGWRGDCLEHLHRKGKKLKQQGPRWWTTSQGKTVRTSPQLLKT
ncbi:hypothetical protein XENOCAPTIV_019192 [Xenoophorus captivus]|uniref:Secreted protein n=1 Tax=Xenoophorus captivus TaxID=1517983 RepID=A0ABV0RI28_9TELE